RDDHLPGAALEVRRGLFLAGEEARALEHEVDAQRAPGQRRGVAVGEHADAIAVDDHLLAFDGDLAGKAPVRGVVARQVRVGLGAAEVVDRDDRKIVLLAALVVRAQRVAADASIAVDRHLDRHAFWSPRTLNEIQWTAASRVAATSAGRSRHP